MNSSFLVVGRQPPPVTGENLCRAFLINSLLSLNYSVSDFSRGNWRIWFFWGKQVWLLPGSKPHGYARDFVFIIWWLLVKNRVTVYVHNKSWLYFIRDSWFWSFIGRGRLRFIVLTDSIKYALDHVDLECARLDNTIPDGNEPSKATKPNPFRLIWMSSLTKEKGFLVACNFFNVLRKLDNRWSFDVYGEGPLKSQAQGLNGVFMHGLVRGEKKQDALSEGGIMILPSCYVNETQPLALIEALAYGIPILSSNVGGITAIVGEGKDAAGIALSPSVSISEWVESLLAISVDFDRYSAVARERYVNNFSRDKYKLRLSAILAG
jgi:glycosyltransferase involved in cell wall biosynthesis